MSATISTIFRYPVFDTANHGFNYTIFMAQLAAKNLSIPINYVDRVENDDIRIVLIGLATSEDKTKIDAAIATHSGVDFVALPVSVAALAETNDNDSGIEQEKLALQVGPLENKEYLFSWSMEGAVTTNVYPPVTGCRMRLYSSKNGNPFIEQSVSNTASNQWLSWGACIPIAASAGDTFSFKLTYQRIGSSGNAARAQRARLIFFEN